ncbi:MAG: hypothetical protein GX567_09615 [Clostridia bacterium]|nr:hypothetical protein [Clostridia bacterium]
MGQYIIRDLKIIARRRYTYAYVLGIIALCLIANIAVVGFRMIYGTNDGTFAYNLIEYATWSFIIPYYSCIVISDIVFGKTYPNPRIKDKITKNLNRTQIYFSKLLGSLVLAVLFLLVAFIMLMGTTTLFQYGDGTMQWWVVEDFLDKMWLAVPLWFAGISIANMCLFITKHKIKAYISFFAIVFVIPRTIMLFAAEPFEWGIMRTIRTYLISQNFGLLPYPADPARNVTLILILGVGYALIASIVGVIAFNKKKF